MSYVNQVDELGYIRDVRLSPAAVTISLVGTAQGLPRNIEIIDQTGDIGNIRCLFHGTIDITGKANTTANITHPVAIDILLAGIVIVWAVVTGIPQAVAVTVIVVQTEFIGTPIAQITMTVAVGVDLAGIGQAGAIIGTLTDAVAVGIVH